MAASLHTTRSRLRDFPRRKRQRRYRALFFVLVYLSAIATGGYRSVRMKFCIKITGWHEAINHFGNK